jgi:hypothetical protein
LSSAACTIEDAVKRIRAAALVAELILSSLGGEFGP